MLLLFSFFAFAQEQFENAGFEEWEPITDQFSEPAQWSTIKTCVPENIASLAPVPLSKETENVHSGSAAVHLITMGTMAGAANGMMTNGRVHASFVIEEGYNFIDPHHDDWNTVITRRPDSVAGWYRANPQPGDYGAIKIVLSTDSTAIPATDSSNWVAYAKYEFPSEVVSEWKRFSFPVTYYNNENPKYLLSVFTSSRGFEATEGSEIWFDDLEFIYNENNAISEIADHDFNVYSYRNNLYVYVKSAKKQMLNLNIVDMQGKVVKTDRVYTNQKKNLHLKVNEGVYVAVFTTEKGEKFSKKIFIK